MALEPLSDSRTAIQIKYDHLHAKTMREATIWLRNFEDLETLKGSLVEEDARIASHARIKTAVQSITDHMKDTSGVTNGISQDVIDKATTVSAL